MNNTCPHCKRTLRYADRCHNCGAVLDLAATENISLKLAIVREQGELARNFALTVIGFRTNLRDGESSAVELVKQICAHTAHLGSVYLNN